MKKISAIILAGNRENLIEGCLKSILWVDEIIVVDLHSTDKTLLIAKKYNCSIIKGDEKYDFSQWRNQGAKAARTEWLLYVDTDERVTLGLKKEILNNINNQPLDIKRKPLVNAFYLPRENWFLGKEFKTTFPDYQLRLIKKSALIAWSGNIHETPKIKGKIDYLKNSLIHLAFNHQNLENAVLNTLNWSKLEAANRFKAGHPQMNGWRFLRILFTGFWNQFGKKRIWREGTEGIIEGIYQMFSLFFTYVRLWQMQRKESLERTYQKIEREFKT